MKYRLLILLLLIPLMAGADAVKVRPAVWAQPVIGTALDNLYKVSDDVYRAEQPGKKDIPDLQRLKIRTLLNLREYHEDEAAFEDSDIRRIHYRMSAGALTARDLAAVLLLIRHAEKPVLIHCWHGSDRTGFVVAGYRILFQNWTKEAAIEELRLGGFGYHAKAYPNILRTLGELDVDAVRKAVLQK